MIINILQHDEILRSAQDDMVSGLIKGERRGDSKSNIVNIFEVCIESPLLSPLYDPKMHCHPERSEGSAAFSRDFKLMPLEYFQANCEKDHPDTQKNEYW